MDRLKSAAAKVGLILNERKCEVISPTPLTSAPNTFSNFRQILIPEATMLGAPLFGGKAMDETWESHSDNLHRAASRLINLSSHDALVILKHSLSLPKLLFTLRCTFSGDHPIPPLMDAKMRELLSQILNVDLTDEQWDQATLPVKWGGIGIRKTVQVAPSAFLASAAGVVDLVSAILPAKSRQMASSSSDIALSTWKSFGGETPPGLQEARIQKLWDGQIIKKVSEGLRDRAPDDYARARLLAVSAPHSGDWLNAPPISAVGLRLSNETLRISAGLRLGANLCAPHVCRCTAPVDARGHHGLSCTRSAGRQMRHSLLNDIIFRALSRAKVASVKEPAGLVPGTSLRPDGATLIPWTKGKCLAWDATCADTMAQSHLTGTRSASGSAAMHASSLKHQKYSNLSPSHSLIAVAVETFGSWSQEGLEFVKELGKRISASTGDPRETSFLFQRLSVAVQMGNAACIMGTLPVGADEDD